MSEPIVYLAGHILNCHYAEATNWRSEATERLNAAGFMVLSPMRGYEFLRGRMITDSATKTTTENNPLATDRWINRRDMSDIRRCDLIIMNLIEEEPISIGSMMELGAAWVLQKPVILIIHRDDKRYEHPMVRDCATAKIDSLDEAVNLAVAFLKAKA